MTEPVGTEIPWDHLRAEARRMAERAYAPYSGFSVGAAAFTTSGRTVRGCNVENASYGVTLCAECGLISDLVAQGAGRLLAIVVVSGSGEHCTPCGRCRQLLLEHSTENALIDSPDGPHDVADLLPGHFDAERLESG